MEIFVVGGAVRDALMGLPVNDRDWVVVGSTPEAMAAQGYQPVGKDFPVFLHPDSREEYALARTERKTARGYKGFAVQAAPDVTLEEDLARRDLTINAMAVPQTLAHAAPDVPPDKYPALGARYRFHYAARQNDLSLFEKNFVLMLEEGGYDLIVAFLSSVGQVLDLSSALLLQLQK